MVCVRGISEALGVTRAWLLLVKLGGEFLSPTAFYFVFSPFLSSLGYPWSDLVQGSTPLGWNKRERAVGFEVYRLQVQSWLYFSSAHGQVFNPSEPPFVFL